ncbi:MAG: UDP-N-acetylmuramoyl-tripeptide--D-alanyl-D-alanine ligase [Pseudomonadota bacterium]
MKHLPLRVDVNLNPDEIVQAMKAKQEGKPSREPRGVALDTRAVQEGDLFFALQATRDGHDFTAEAFARGACAAVIHHDVDATGPFLRVRDTLEALGAVANLARRKWGKPVVAISGSNGKTTTKEMAAAVIGAHRNTLKTPGTWNNYLGVPLTLLLLRPEHALAVLELGVNNFGEMGTLCRLAEPTVGVLTNIGPVHLEKLGSLDGVAKAKGELYEHLPENGVAVINIDDPRLKSFEGSTRARKITISLRGTADVSAKVVRDLGSDGLVLSVRYGAEEAEIRTPFVGIHNVYNLMCAFGAALAMEVPVLKLQTGVQAVERPEMRLQMIPCPKGIRIVNDCYNANPGSMTVALEVVRDFAQGRYLAALGDMLELGDFSPRAHRDIGIKVAGFKYSRLFVMGRYAGDVVQGAVQGGMKHERIKTFKTHAEMAQAILEQLEPNDTLLVKGSRGMKMELLTEELQKGLAERGA